MANTLSIGEPQSGHTLLEATPVWHWQNRSHNDWPLLSSFCSFCRLFLHPVDKVTFVSLLYFRPFAWECVSSSFDASSHLFFSLGLVLCLPFVSALGSLLVYLRDRGGLMESQLECWRQICIARAFDFFWALVQLVYLPVATTALSTFNCRKDNGPDYMTSAPYLECHRSDMLTVSILSWCWCLLFPFFLFPFGDSIEPRKQTTSTCWVC